MENKSIFRKSFLSISHLPTIILIIGYISYWIELYFIKRGKGLTSPLAYILFISFSVFVLFVKRKEIFQFLSWLTKEYKKQKKFTRYFLTASFGIILLISIIVFFALLQPPHLCQEFDALNYHLTLPRQHLILNSFRHIRWSSADLFPLPIQFALAPYWLIREIPSKFIQIFFIFGLVTISINLVRRFSRNNFLSLCIITLAILGSHNVGIQMPVLMLGIVVCYLFIAGIDSFLKKKYLLSAIEFSFFIWSKSFYAPQIILILIAILLLNYFFKKFRIKKTSWGFEKSTYDNFISKKAFKKIALYIFFASIVIGGPFILKSLYYTGTPLFPFFPGLIDFSHIDQSSGHWQSILTSSQLHLSTKDAYGSGRGVLDFIKHFWILAVPERGVMSRYDYPLGLPYLLFIGPFIYLFVKSIRKKEFALIPIFIIIYWISWWFGSQQARFLYIPLILIFITVSGAIKNPTKIFIFCLLLSLSINSISIFRAHYKDLGKPAMKVLRDKDKKLLLLNEEYVKRPTNKVITLEDFNVAYANFPVKIIPPKENDPLWVLQH
ncbi:MAG: hypothetical protein ISS47_01525 [Candidatus Omnitrophica bacterium]|nr:hypothetical protein [Candidatus Omnitrophota bacterium]